MNSTARLLLCLLGLSILSYVEASALQPRNFDTNCYTCQWVVGAIEDWIQQNTTEQEVIAYLHSVCAWIPTFEPICDTLMDEAVDDVIKWIIKTETPDAICTKLSYCGGSGYKSLASASAFGTSCFVCEQVVTTVEGWLDGEATKEEIEGMLDQICKLVPMFEDTCTAIIRTGVPTVIAWIHAYENGTVVCTQLQVCSANEYYKALPQGSQLAPQLKKDNSQCEICKTIIVAVESWVEANATLVEIEANLEKIVCNLIPAFETVCNTLVEAGVPTFVKWIEMHEDAATICFQLSMCEYFYPFASKLTIKRLV